MSRLPRLVIMLLFPHHALKSDARDYRRPHARRFARHIYLVVSRRDDFARRPLTHHSRDYMKYACQRERIARVACHCVAVYGQVPTPPLVFVPSISLLFSPSRFDTTARRVATARYGRSTPASHIGLVERQVRARLPKWAYIASAQMAMTLAVISRTSSRRATTAAMMERIDTKFSRRCCCHFYTKSKNTHCRAPPQASRQHATLDHDFSARH